VQRCIDEGFFPVSLHADTALRLLWAPVLGIASMRLSNRLAPGEDAEALVRDAISTTIAGLRAGVATHSVTSCCSNGLKESHSDGSLQSLPVAAPDPGPAGERMRRVGQP
jgi:hypothetical protein